MQASGAAQLCDTGDTPQLQMYRIYASIMLAEVKGYVMTTFAFSFLKLYEKGKDEILLTMVIC